MSAPNIVTIAVSYPETVIKAFQVGDAPTATVDVLNIGTKLRYRATSTGGVVEVKGIDSVWRVQREYTQ